MHLSLIALGDNRKSEAATSEPPNGEWTCVIPCFLNVGGSGASTRVCRGA